jgi:hypothetical protein
MLHAETDVVQSSAEFVKPTKANIKFHRCTFRKITERK